MTLATAAFATPGRTAEGVPSPAPVRILLESPPLTLNPRRTTDAVGQRLGALMFRALTRIDADLDPQPDLASRWETSRDGLTWRFLIPPGLADQAGQPITPERIARCLESYRSGRPISVHRAAFPSWTTTESGPDSVTLKLSRPDPYLARNVTLLRYFTVAGSAEPCTEPSDGRPVVASGRYRPAHWSLNPEDRLVLEPWAPQNPPDARPLEFLFVPDDNARALRLIRGDADAVQNALTLSKERWLRSEFADRFEVLERDGVSVGYLAFNLRDPALAKPEVRRAIAESLDRESIIRHKLAGFCSPAGSLLSPLLPESSQAAFRYDPDDAERLLERAGYPRGPDGTRLTLHYKSTPVREGFETALMFQEMLKKVGIRLVVDVVEPAVFLSSIRKGGFQLYSSRWLGVADGSILYRTLHSGQPGNRGGYSDPGMDQLLERAQGEMDPGRRKELLKRVQSKAASDLPYFPLWYWNTTLILRKGLQGVDARHLSLSGALEPLTHLR